MREKRIKLIWMILGAVLLLWMGWQLGRLEQKLGRLLGPGRSGCAWVLPVGP